MAKIHRTSIRIETMPLEYPKALDRATSLLIQERENFVPRYMHSNTMNFLEAVVIDAERRDDPNLQTIKNNSSKSIEVFKGRVKNVVRGMWEWGIRSPFFTGLVLSDDLDSPEPALTKPEDVEYDFELRLKPFDLGLTGRLLQSTNGETFEELLTLHPSIFDLYSFAQHLSPRRIVSVDHQGNREVIYEDSNEVGETTKSRPDEEQRKSFLFYKKENRFSERDYEVISAEGLVPVFDDFYAKLQRYQNQTMLFGHEFSNLREFLEYATMSDNHILWKICNLERHEERHGNAPLVDCEKLYGLKNRVREMPENKDRLHLMPNKVYIDLGYGTYINFDYPTAIRSLVAIQDKITDIWFEPIGRKFDKGWDVVYDRRRGVVPEKPVAVYCNSDYERFSVLKSFKARCKK